MAFGDGDQDALLRDAWARYCDMLKQAGEHVFKDAAPTSPEERAEGFRHLTQGIRLGLEFFVENDMPHFPYLMRYFSPTRKQGGDNADGIVLGAFIDGNETYRIVGDRGSVPWVVFTVLRAGTPDDPWYGIGAPYNMALDAEPLLGPDLEVEWDGSFVVTLSPEPHSGNWIRTTPQTRAVRIRQGFGDWEREQPMRLQIDRVDAEGAPPLLTPERWISMLDEAGSFALRTTQVWGSGPLTPNQPLNQMTALPVPAAPGRSLIGMADVTPRSVTALCRSQITRDEALVIEFRPEPALLWSFELDNPWASTMDYRWRLSSLNAKHAALEPDGSVRAVLAHRDPGIPNWLDASGWSRCAIYYRAYLSERLPRFDCKVVPLTELDARLPADARRIDTAGRRDQLRRRRAGVTRRFPV